MVPPFSKCVELKKSPLSTEEECTPTFTAGYYGDLNVSFNWGGVQWKDGQCVANSCPTVSKNFVKVPESVLNDGDLFKACNKLGCLVDLKGRKCFPMKLVTFIIIMAASFLGLVILGIVGCCLCCCLCKKKPAERVEVSNAETAGLIAGLMASTAALNASTAAALTAGKDGSVPTESGVYVVIKLGKQELQTKKVKNDPQPTWADSIEFVGLGPEDDDASFELKNDADLVGTGSLRLVDYVNKKTGVSVSLKDFAGVEVLVLEVDVEVQTDETQAVPQIKAVFFVDKGSKPGEEVVPVVEDAVAVDTSF